MNLTDLLIVISKEEHRHLVLYPLNAELVREVYASLREATAQRILKADQRVK